MEKLSEIHFMESSIHYLNFGAYITPKEYDADSVSSKRHGVSLVKSFCESKERFLTVRIYMEQYIVSSILTESSRLNEPKLIVK